jgi:hypothetical protein
LRGGNLSGYIIRTKLDDYPNKSQKAAHSSERPFALAGAQPQPFSQFGELIADTSFRKLHSLWPQVLPVQPIERIF